MRPLMKLFMTLKTKTRDLFLKSVNFDRFQEGSLPNNGQSHRSAQLWLIKEGHQEKAIQARIQKIGKEAGKDRLILGISFGNGPRIGLLGFNRF